MHTETTSATPVTEMTPDELEIEKYLLDLALQPLDEFEGFVQIEKFFSSAFRYQLNFVCYALAMAQYTRTPAFTGYLAEAQANTIEKMRDKRVWSYWRPQNAVGYGSLNPDPIVHANVMYTGYYAAMLGVFQTLNDARFSEPGALTLRWNDRKSFTYDYGSLAEAIRRNMEESRDVLYPCEPRMTFPICNTLAIDGLAMFDRLHGTSLTGDLVDRMADSHRLRYLREDGRFVSGRGPLGLTLAPSTVNDAMLSYWLHYTMPEQAEELWQILRARLVRVVDGKAEVETARGERIDFGNYARGNSLVLATVFAAAKEHGDSEIADAVEATMHENHEIVRRNGARQYEGLSVLGNAMFALGLFTRPAGARELMLGQIPAGWRTGPVLANAAYPDVLVARAVTDGESLDLVLRPGAGEVATTLGIERLLPGREYVVDGAAIETIIADGRGCALVEVLLRDRLELRIRPAA